MDSIARVRSAARAFGRYRRVVVRPAIAPWPRLALLPVAAQAMPAVAAPPARRGLDAACYPEACAAARWDDAAPLRGFDRKCGRLVSEPRLWERAAARRKSAGDWPENPAAQWEWRGCG